MIEYSKELEEKDPEDLTDEELEAILEELFRQLGESYRQNYQEGPRYILTGEPIKDWSPKANQDTTLT